MDLWHSVIVLYIAIMLFVIYRYRKLIHNLISSKKGTHKWIVRIVSNFLFWVMLLVIAHCKFVKEEEWRI